MDIEANLRTYLGQRTPTGRYTSFDYCYNHFQLHRERGALSELVVGPNLQLSCLHLAFYLASWGMLRASSALEGQTSSPKPRRSRPRAGGSGPGRQFPEAPPGRAWQTDHLKGRRP